MTGYEGYDEDFCDDPSSGGDLGGFFDCEMKSEMPDKPFYFAICDASGVTCVISEGSGKTRALKSK